MHRSEETFLGQSGLESLFPILAPIGENESEINHRPRCC